MMCQKVLMSKEAVQCNQISGRENKINNGGVSSQELSQTQQQQLRIWGQRLRLRARAPSFQEVSFLVGP